MTRTDETEKERERGGERKAINAKVYLIGVVQSTIVAPVFGLSLHSTRKLARTHETGTPIPVDIVPSAQRYWKIMKRFALAAVESPRGSMAVCR